RAPGVGHLTPQFTVTHDGRTALLDELTGGGFVLLTDGEAPLADLDAADRAFLRSIGACLVPLTESGGEWTDPPGGYLPHLREHGHVGALVRPDFYLFGTAADATGVRDLVGQLRTQLRAPAHGTDHAPAPAPHTGATAPDGGPLTAAS
ncbi:monooxygenase, partial [Streptomyces sp. SID11385]|nr:monooxygenase [Streptomyces sp. SID11385]